jgi:hypothetical protein
VSRRFRSAAARTAAQPSNEALENARRSYQASRAMRYVIRPFLMALMVGALGAGVVSLIRQISGDARWSSMLVLFFLVTIEGIYTTNWLQHPTQLSLDRAAYRAAEILLVVVMLRLGTWLVFAGGWPDREALLDALRNPAGLFIDPIFLIALATGILMWRFGTMLSKIFYELEVSEFELRYFSLPPAQRKERADDQPIRLERRAMVQNFTRVWLWGGMLLSVLVAITRLEGRSLQETLLSPLAAGGADVPAGLLAALLAYFLIGLWLLSQARLLEMDARWLLNGVEKDDQMRRTWQRASLAILLGIALFAAFLPIGSTTALSQLVNLLIVGLLFLAQVIVFIFTLPFALLLALLSGNAEMPRPTPPASPQALLEQNQGQIGPISETVTMVLSSAFWTLLIAGVVVALLFFIRERRQRAEDDKLSLLWAGFVAWLGGLWGRLHGRLAALQLQLPAQNKGSPQASAPGGGWRRRFRRINSLPPREQVRAIYLMAVQRAGQQGVTREPVETPLEYVEELEKQWPEAEEALEDLTAAFLKARYSDQSITAEDLPQVRQTWQAVQREMRQKKQAPPAARDDEAPTKE